MSGHAIGTGQTERRGNLAFAAGLIIAGLAALGALPRPWEPPPPQERDPVHAAPQAKSDAPGAPVLDVAAALASFRLAPGVRIHAAASEPRVVAPVTAAFDEDGRLWVAEMRTYMRDLQGTGEGEARNRVVVLTGSHADGVFDRSSVFLDGLALPRAIAPCFGGALVLEPPSLYFCRDSDNDGHADVKQKLLDGFTGLDNPEHAANGLVYGLDNWYHLSQHNVDIRFDGENVRTRPTPTLGQWGITQDSAGRMYTTPNSDPLLIDLVPRHYGARNRHQGSLSFLGRSIVRDRSVYPAHPTPGVNRGYQRDVLRADLTLNTVTAACGPALYDSDGLGAGFRGSAFVCEPAGNAVKRYVFDVRDSIPAGRNPYDKSEFLASTDERFRPVNAVVGPDGALYVLDMYRGVIQHKLFVTPYLREQVMARGLESPVDMGRIYRISGENSPSGSRPNLSSATDVDLVGLLAHTDQWWRLTAQRLLVERRASSVSDDVRALLGSGTSEEARLHALWTLEGLGEITEKDVAGALEDDSPAVRASGIRIAERLLGESFMVERVVAMLDDADVWVRVQAACTLGELPADARLPRLAQVLERFAGDRSMRDATISGLQGHELAVLRELAKDEAWAATKEARHVISDLADCVLRADAPARTDLVEFVAGLASEDHVAAEGLLARIRAAQRLDSDKPRPISLSREPRRWISAMGERFNTLGARMGESEVYFDWPDRPPVRRVHGTRPLTTSELAQFERGRVVYMQTCASCHMGDGRGSSGVGPALAASPIAEGDAERFATVLIHGLEGTWSIGSMTYEAAMPPAPVPGDDDLAAVMTYVRRAFGNAADPVRPGDVARARAAHRDRDKPWTRGEIEKWATPASAGEK